MHPVASAAVLSALMPSIVYAATAANSEVSASVDTVVVKAHCRRAAQDTRSNCPAVASRLTLNSVPGSHAAISGERRRWDRSHAGSSPNAGH